MLYAVDLFAGAGCASIGFKKAGFSILSALEIDAVRCENYRDNVGMRPIEGDAAKITGEDIMSDAGLKRREPFCLIGCPPCQSFSKLSETSGLNAKDDPRSMHVLKFARLVEDMRPSVVVFENVASLLTGPGRTFFDKYCNRLEKAGYRTVFDIVNAADYGVPQFRRRVLAISCLRKRGVTLSLPDKIVGTDDTIRFPKTVRDAIGRLRPLKSGESDRSDKLHSARSHPKEILDRLRHIPKDGGSRKSLPKKYWLKCHVDLRGATSVYGRMRWDGLSPTITGRCTTVSSGRFVHPDQHRAITLREAARLQTIPDTMQLKGTVGQIEQMIGDAVPVNLAERIAMKAAEILIA